MKRLLLTACVLALSAALAYAGGDQVRGENGQGSVNQVQVQDPPPFQDDTDALTALFLMLFE